MTTTTKRIIKIVGRDGDQNGDDTRNTTILEWAQTNTTTEDDWRKLLVEGLFSMKDIADARDKYVSTALHYAAGSGTVETCQFLLSVIGIDPAIRSNNTGRTALHWAARNGRTEICRLLLLLPCSSSTATITTTNDNIMYVDVQAKGQVTPLQLAMWQGHLETAQVLHELGADPHFVNAWGCGVAHWLAKCPNYCAEDEECEDEEQTIPNTCNITHHSKAHLGRCCRWLMEECGVPHNESNHHGQTPLHKAAFAGNLPVVEYLVHRRGVQDDGRDHQGNTAADCAERSSSFDCKTMAIWIRRHASPIRTQALKRLGLLLPRHENNYWNQVRQEERRSTAGNGDCSLSGTTAAVPPTPSNVVVVMPTLDELRSTYHTLAKGWHPDRRLCQKRNDSLNQGRHDADINGSSESSSWNSLQEAYHLLVDWWVNPTLYDAKVRLATRNAALHDYPALLWLPEWHLSSSSSSLSSLQTLKTSPLPQAQNGSNDGDPEERLAQFERRLISLLLTDAHRETGLSLAQLPKEYQKNWHQEQPEERTPMMIHPKDYKCRKWSDLLQRRFSSTIRLEVDPSGKQQPRVFARVG